MIELVTTGMGALLGDMYARNEKNSLTKTFSAFEWVIHTVVTIIYSICGIMIVPFVKIYTQGIDDANYIVPIFAALIVLAGASYSLRLPYNTMVQAAGHFKSTQASAVIEATLNVAVSSILVWRFGLVGVAIGTLIAMLYRTIYLAWYLKSNILFRPITVFIKNIIVDVIIAAVGIALSSMVPKFESNFGYWLIKALVVAIIVSGVSLIFNIVFYQRELKGVLALIAKRKK